MTHFDLAMIRYIKDDESQLSIKRVSVREIVLM